MSTATELQNPYLAARHIYNERYLSLSKSIRNWQLTAGGLLLANTALTGGLVHVTGKQQVAPYVVEVDAAGSAAAIRELRAEAVHDPLVIAALLKRFLVEIRTVSTDAELVRRQMNAAYRMCLQGAQAFLAAYYTEHPVAELAKRGRTFPLNVTVTPLSPTSWRARWKEQLLSDDGTTIAESEWEATIEVALVLPRTADERQRSPLGLWVANLQWAEV